MNLLFEEKCIMPEQNTILKIMQKHLKAVSNFTYSDTLAGFTADKYEVEFKEGKMPPQLLIMHPSSASDYVMDELERSQLWDCPDSETILEKCKHSITAADFLSKGMEYKQRAEMLMDFMEALIEIYPNCKAIQFRNSGKMFAGKQIINHQAPKEYRFIHFAVNVRFFNIQGTEDMLIDSLGMGTLFLPDIQYHFHGLQPQWIVNHAYNTLYYMFKNNCPFENNDSIDGVKDGELNKDVKWSVQYEEALIQPVRHVIDINMKEYAAGNRNSN